MSEELFQASEHAVVRIYYFKTAKYGEFSGRKSLFDLVRAERELGERLKRKFELVTYNSLNPLIRDSVLADEVRII